MFLDTSFRSLPKTDLMDPPSASSSIEEYTSSVTSSGGSKRGNGICVMRGDRETEKA